MTMMDIPNQLNLPRTTLEPVSRHLLRRLCMDQWLLIAVLLCLAARAGAQDTRTAIL
jgi:hypothetical protein